MHTHSATQKKLVALRRAVGRTVLSNYLAGSATVGLLAVLDCTPQNQELRFFQLLWLPVEQSLEPQVWGHIQRNHVLQRCVHDAVVVAASRVGNGTRQHAQTVETEHGYIYL